MKKYLLITLAASVAMLSTSSKAIAAVPEGYITHELSSFSVNLPSEFEKSEGWSSESQMSFNSNAINLREDGEEYISSATINVYEMEGNITNLDEYAENMKWSIKAMDETLDDTIVEGNTVIHHSTSDVGDGYLINWRFIVVNEDGRVAGGTISYRGEEANIYDGIVMPIIQSVQFK